jgi:hypothetical protein
MRNTLQVQTTFFNVNYDHSPPPNSPSFMCVSPTSLFNVEELQNECDKISTNSPSISPLSIIPSISITPVQTRLLSITSDSISLSSPDIVSPSSLYNLEQPQNESERKFTNSLLVPPKDEVPALYSRKDSETPVSPSFSIPSISISPVHNRLDSITGDNISHISSSSPATFMVDLPQYTSSIMPLRKLLNPIVIPKRNSSRIIGMLRVPTITP